MGCLWLKDQPLVFGAGVLLWQPLGTDNGHCVVILYTWYLTPDNHHFFSASTRPSTATLATHARRGLTEQAELTIIAHNS